jgi:putative addiction module component (TIGR02574 family)
MKIDQLSASEKVVLAQQLWDSVAVDQNAVALTSAQKTELDNRIAKFESDQDTGSDWNTVKSRIVNS